MVVDVHCHVGLTARRVEPAIPRFSFELDGAAGSPGYDSYISPRFFAIPSWFFITKWMGLDRKLPRGDELDRQIEAVNERHFANCPSVDRLALLAFDEVYDDAGMPQGMAPRGHYGSDLYASNSFVRAMCVARPEKFVFAASIHPYRPGACEMLAEVAAGGAKLVKWLPIHQNIDIEDSRTIAFLRDAARLNVPLLIHYGGEMSLSRQHMEFESPLPLLGVLRRLRADGRMPTVIVAHVATPSFIWQRASNCWKFIDAMCNEFRDAPLYADISALAAFGRTPWLKRLAPRRDLHFKLIFGTDFPIPVMISYFWRQLSRSQRAAIRTLPSWIEQDYQLKKMMGFDECVFTEVARLLKLN
jgi:uncharacterized protein